MFERIAGCMVILISLVVLVMAGFVLYIAIDKTGIETTKTTTTEVTKKWYEPPMTTSTFVMHGKMLVPITHRKPEAYKIGFVLEGEDKSCKVELEIYDQLSVGKKIIVEYGHGRFSKKYWPTSVSPITETQSP